jgi:hypothetical protein
MPDVLPETTDADIARGYAERNGMERELCDALAVPRAKNLTVRVLYALSNAGIKTRADVIARGTDGLYRVPNLGPSGIAFIRQRLNGAAMNAEITINGESLAVPVGDLTYETVVELSGESGTPSVKWTCGDKAGILRPGSCMTFTVIRTDNA